MLSLLGPLCSLRYHLVFFSGKHIFYQFRQQTFFPAHILNKLFFSDFCGDKLFFSRPPRYQMVRP